MTLGVRGVLRRIKCVYTRRFFLIFECLFYSLSVRFDSIIFANDVSVVRCV